MTIANTVTEITYNGDGLNVTFAIPFAYIPSEVSVIKVYLIDALGVETLQILTADYTLDDPNNPVNVVMNVAPLATEDLAIRRISPRTQPTDLVNNSPGHEESVETQLDRNVLVTQEIDKKLTDLENTVTGGTTTVLSTFPDWGAAVAYKKDQVVIEVNKMYRATVDHTSGVFSVDLVAVKWELLETEGIQGPVGIQGIQGAQGIQGNAGTNGVAGANGANGIFSQIASTPEAEAGLDDTKGMSPLKTKQAVIVQLPLHADIISMKADIAANANNLALLTTRVTLVESLVQQATGKFSGQQILLNNSGPTELLGNAASANILDCGTPLERSGVGTEFAKVLVVIRRKTDTGDRVSSFDLVMQYVDGTWFMGREDTTQLDSSLDLDGVILTINTVAQVGTISYTTNLMAGANHDTQSLISWLGQEISRC